MQVIEAVASKKRGRPAAAGARYPSGDIRPERDNGTKRAQTKRQALVGDNADPVLSEYPLGVLLARRLIGPDQHAAGIYFAWVWGRYTQLRTVPWASRLDSARAPAAQGLPSPEKLKPWYVDLVRLVSPCTRRICLEYGFPPWFAMTLWTPTHAAELLTIQRELAALGRGIALLHERHGHPG